MTRFLLFIFLISIIGNSTDPYGKIRFLTLNMHAGKSLTGQDNLDSVAALIIKIKPDLVALQEVDSATDRSRGRDQLAYLAERTGMKGNFARNIKFQNGAYGLGILSRYPVTSYEHLLLPGKPGREQRGMQFVEVTIHNQRRLVFVNTHLDHWENDSLRFFQIQVICRLIRDRHPDVLLGDFNDTPDSRSIQALLIWMNSNDTIPTWPLPEPKKKIDYIFLNPEFQSTTVKISCIFHTFSDHAALIAELSLP